MTKNEVKVFAKHPSACKEEEIDEFIRLVEKGNEVDNSRLSCRVKQAERLIFVGCDNRIIGVGAIKNPNESYKRKMFRKADREEDALNFDYEIGYIYICDSYRNKGFAKCIMKKIEQFLNGKKCFATTHNKTMARILCETGFKQLGEKYDSKRISRLYVGVIHKIAFFILLDSRFHGNDEYRKEVTNRLFYWHCHARERVASQSQAIGGDLRGRNGRHICPCLDRLKIDRLNCALRCGRLKLHF